MRSRLLAALAVLILAALPMVSGEAAPRRATPTATRAATRTPTPVAPPRAPTATPRPMLPTATPIEASQQRKTYLPLSLLDPTPTPAPRTAMAVGANVIDNNFEMVDDLGLPWIKLYSDWDGADPEAMVDGARSRYPGVKILLRIDRSPVSARTGIDDDPIDHAALRNHLRNLSFRLRGKVQAYELFNEPNLKWEWNSHIAGGGGMPSVRGYTRVLQTAYAAIKEMDANAVVIHGGLSSAGNGGPEAVGDLAWIDGLYSSGARGFFDAIGTHPYGGPHAFDAGAGDPHGVYFRRAEEQRAAMVRNGDGERTMWATELGWLVDPRVYGYGHCMPGLGGRAEWVRSPTDVANQLTAAYRYAADNWPWMAGLFFFNFDYSAAGWVQGYDKTCDAPAWYSIVSKNNMPGRPYVEPAYDVMKRFILDYRL